MNLNLFENIKKNIESKFNVKNFMEELAEFLDNKSLQKEDNNFEISEKNNKTDISESNEKTLEQKNNNLYENRKEGHLYLVTEDRNNKIYLWDFTDKAKTEFEENLTIELLDVAKEGTMLQYKNGKYELYSKDGYDMLFNE